MPATKKIHEFAIKYLKRYSKRTTCGHEVEEGFAEECFALDFVMDCGQSFTAAYPEANVFYDYAHLEYIIDEVTDVQLLGSAIFSEWRYITHWSVGESLLSNAHRPWFIIAFSRLAALTFEDKTEPAMLREPVQKIRIVTNNIWRCPEPEEEVEQYLTMTADGYVWFSGFKYGKGFGKFECIRMQQIYLEKAKINQVFSVLFKYFTEVFDDIFIKDIGSWKMTMTNTEGREFFFKGSMCADYKADGMYLSEMLRDVLKIKDLFVFDGNKNQDKIDRIAIDYHRITKSNPKCLQDENSDGKTEDYTEQLTIDRESEYIELAQRIDLECEISHKYKIKKAVPDFLDYFDADTLFEYIEGNPADAVEDPNETREYTITIDFRKKPGRILRGTYDKRGLPEDWPEFIEELSWVMRHYGSGEIFRPSVYYKEKRRASDCIFCSVAFTDGGKSYYYLTEDDTIEVGGLVMVPAGKDNHTAIARVVDIEYFAEEAAPFPIEKTKHIIRKCNDEDLKQADGECRLGSGDGMSGIV